MKCNECLELLTSVIFEETPDSQELAIHEHLAACDSCREEYIELLETKLQLESSVQGLAEPVGLSQAQKENILSVADEDKSGKKPLTVPSWFFALAACIAVAVIVGVNMKDNSPQMAKSKEVNTLIELESADEAEGEPVPEAEMKSKALKLNYKSEEKKQDGTLEKSEAFAAAKEELAVDKVKPAKAKKRMERKAPAAAPQMLSEAVADMEVSAKAQLSVQMFREMLKKASLKDSSQLTELKGLIETVGALKDSQIQLQFLPENIGSKNGPQKILIRILDNGKKAIDYAHIFVHNQNIIQVERVK